MVPFHRGQVASPSYRNGMGEATTSLSDIIVITRV